MHTGRKTIASRNDSPRIGLSIEEAGALIGLGRQAAYRAAAAGHIPTIRIGARRLIVPKAPFYKKFGLEISAPSNGGAIAKTA